MSDRPSQLTRFRLRRVAWKVGLPGAVLLVAGLVLPVLVDLVIAEVPKVPVPESS